MSRRSSTGRFHFFATQTVFIWSHALLLGGGGGGCGGGGGDGDGDGDGGGSRQIASFPAVNGRSLGVWYVVGCCGASSSGSGSVGGDDVKRALLRRANP